MRHRTIVMIFVLFSAATAHAQRATTPAERSDAINRKLSADAENGLRDLHNLEIKTVRDVNDLSAGTRAIYRKPTKKEMEILAPSQDLIEKYADFLRQPNTGIIKLNADARCAQNAETITAVENCSDYKIPGGGTAYSFRFDSYRIPRLADLILVKDVLKTDGVLQQGIMVDLGDVPIEGITLQSDGLPYLADFKPAADKNDMAKIDHELITGIKDGGFVYRLGFYANEKRTFALRSIAYQGGFMRSQNGLTYDEFMFDKRKDVLVVFRVVETEPNGNITILWKELARHNAPTLKAKT